MIVCGQDREAALARLRQALGEFKIAGLETNLPFLGGIIRDERFVRGEYDTSFLDDHEPLEISAERLQAAMMAAVLHKHTRNESARRALSASQGAGVDPWKSYARNRGVRGL